MTKKEAKEGLKVVSVSDVKTWCSSFPSLGLVCWTQCPSFPSLSLDVKHDAQVSQSGSRCWTQCQEYQAMGEQTAIIPTKPSTPNKRLQGTNALELCWAGLSRRGRGRHRRGGEPTGTKGGSIWTSPLGCSHSHPQAQVHSEYEKYNNQAVYRGQLQLLEAAMCESPG